MFADERGFVARQMLLALIPYPLRWSTNVCNLSLALPKI